MYIKALLFMMLIIKGHKDDNDEYDISKIMMKLLLLMMLINDELKLVITV